MPTGVVTTTIYLVKDPRGQAEVVGILLGLQVSKRGLKAKDAGMDHRRRTGNCVQYLGSKRSLYVYSCDI